MHDMDEQQRLRKRAQEAAAKKRRWEAMSEEDRAVARAGWRAVAKARREADVTAARTREAAQRARMTPEQKQARAEAVVRWQRRHPKEHSARVSAYQTQRRVDDPAFASKLRRQSMKWRIKSKYGITLDQYDAMHEAQGGLCAICGRAETMVIKGTLCMLAVDHDGATGRVRGLLCVNCNMAIGGLQHDPDLFRAAIAYLEA